MPQIIIGFFATYNHTPIETTRATSRKECTKDHLHYSGSGNFCQVCGNPTKTAFEKVKGYDRDEIRDKIDLSELDFEIEFKRTDSDSQTIIFMPIVSEYMFFGSIGGLDEIIQPNLENANEQTFTQLLEKLKELIGREPTKTGFGMWQDANDD